MLSANDFGSLVQAYVNLSPRFVFSSSVRERNKNIETQGDIKALTPYLPFVLLINPSQYTYNGWNHTTSVAQSVDGAILNVAPNAEYPTITVNGATGDLEIVYQTLYQQAQDNFLFNQTIPEDFTSAIFSRGGMGDTNEESMNDLLNRFYKFMGELADTKNIKTTTFKNVKTWAEEPNVVNDDFETFHNLKRLTIFSALYPLGKTFWGLVIDFSYRNAAETYRNVEWTFTFQIVKEMRNDFNTKDTTTNLPPRLPPKVAPPITSDKVVTTPPPDPPKPSPIAPKVPDVQVTPKLPAPATQPVIQAVDANARATLCKFNYGRAIAAISHIQLKNAHLDSETVFRSLQGTLQRSPICYEDVASYEKAVATAFAFTADDVKQTFIGNIDLSSVTANLLVDDKSVPRTFYGSSNSDEVAKNLKFVKRTGHSREYGEPVVNSDLLGTDAPDAAALPAPSENAPRSTVPLNAGSPNAV